MVASCARSSHLSCFQPLPTALGEAHRVQAAAANDEPIPFDRVGDAGSIGLDRAQVVERVPTLWLACASSELSGQLMM
jgi:hypothetical protein